MVEKKPAYSQHWQQPRMTASTQDRSTYRESVDTGMAARQQIQARGESDRSQIAASDIEIDIEERKAPVQQPAQDARPQNMFQLD